MSGRSGTATCAQGADPSSIKRGRRLPYCVLLIALLLGAAIVKNHGSAIVPHGQTSLARPMGASLRSAAAEFRSESWTNGPEGEFRLARTRLCVVSDRRRGGANPQERSSAAEQPKNRRFQQPLSACRLAGSECSRPRNRSDELPGKANYFIGNDPGKWRTNVPTYAKVRYASVYPGIDLVYYGTRGGELEYDFVVAPGADPKAIAPGNRNPGTCTASGSMRRAIWWLRSPSGNVQLHKPVVYQIGSRRRRPPVSLHQSAPLMHLEGGGPLCLGRAKPRLVLSSAPMTTAGPWLLTRF